jgi:hypothetical protein
VLDNAAARLSIDKTFLPLDYVSAFKVLCGGIKVIHPAAAGSNPPPTVATLHLDLPSRRKRITPAPPPKFKVLDRSTAVQREFAAGGRRDVVGLAYDRTEMISFSR